MKRLPAAPTPSSPARRFARGALLACALAFAASAGVEPRAQGMDEGDGFMRVELPPGGEVRIDNRAGNVSVEVWGEPLVGVAADAEGGARGAGGAAVAAGPPVRIERDGSALAVVAVGAPSRRGAPVRRVNLRLRVPASARLTILTSNGAVEISGAPASVNAQTVSGDLRLRLPADADVMARSLAGTITIGAGLVSPASRVVRERFQARLGAGRSLVRLSTVRGRIVLDPPAENDTARASRETTADRDRRQTIGEPPRVASETQAVQAPQPVPSAPTPARQPPAITGARDESERRPAGTPAAPTDGPIEVDPDEVITVDTQLVTLNLSVVDRQSGRGLTGLARDDFKIFEDGAEQQVSHYEASDAPFDLLLVLDLSGSTAKVTDVIRASALRFAEALRPRDRVGVVAFAASTRVVAPLTDDKRALRSRLESMGAPTGDTKLYDAINFATAYLAENSPKERRRAVILLSDGLDSVLPNVQGDGSALAYEEVRARVQEFDGLFYTVWLDNSYDALSPLDVQPETFNLAADRMEELANLAGGLFYEVERLEDLSGAYERVVRDLGTVYSLSYLPTNKTRDGRWRAVRVRLPRRPEAVARGKSGYRAK